MSECKLDHTVEDVKKKFESQMEFLPLDIQNAFNQFISNEQSQPSLNEVFHLLKKYDLATVEERVERNKKLLQKLI